MHEDISSIRSLLRDKARAFGGGYSGGSLWIALIYLALGVLWIVFSDRLLTFLVNDRELVQNISIAKGIGYVLVTALLLFLMIRGVLMRQVRASQALEQSLRLQSESLDQLRENQLLLAQSEQRYRQLYNALQCGYAVLQVVRGEDNRVCGVRVQNMNYACEQLCGITSGGWLEGSALQVFASPQAQEKWLEIFARVVDNGQTRTEVFHRPNGTDVEIVLFPAGQDQVSCILNDVTERVRMDEALFEEKERLTVTLDSIGDGVIATDNDGHVTVLNDVASQITGFSPAQALGKPVEQVLRQSTAPAVLREGEPLRRADYTVTSLADGSQRVIAENAAPIRSKAGHLLGVVLALRDVTERRIREEKILYLSYHDMLTGLYNRTFFEEEIRRLDTARQLPLAVIMGDVNNLKLVNDVFGHALGDELLRNIALILRESCRTEDIISRWGGDEFTILLPRTERDEALAICERIQCRCSAFRDGAEGYLSPSISLGYSVKTSMDTDIDTAIRAAESTMYSRKLADSREVYDVFVESLLRSLRNDGRVTDEHIARVVWMCVALGREMGLGEPALENLRTAATLQNIGNVIVDSQVLGKPGPLDDQEWEQIHRHPGIGFRIARASAQLVAVSGIILNHHERWDGTGYPTGLKGEHIPLEARILAVVDAYDAMTHHRAYRQTLGPEEAVREIVAYSGTQFDPDVVNAFVCVIGTADDPLGGIAAIS